MDAINRHLKQIVGSLAVTGLLLGLKYGHSWLFRSVDGIQPERIHIFGDPLAEASQSLSPCRSVDDEYDAVWDVAVVTNRTGLSSDRATGDDAADRRDTRSFAQQAMDARYEMPTTTFGFSEVRVPVGRQRGKCSLNPSESDRVVVAPLQTMATEQFEDALRSHVDDSLAKDVFVFVHGFNVRLDESVARAAQMAEDMPFHGVVVAFSWQSLADTGEYRADERSAERYFWNLAGLLANLRRAFDDDVRLHVLAHSMGNRVTLRALNALAGTIGPAGNEVDLFAALRVAGDTSAERAAEPSGLLSRTIGFANTDDEIRRRFPQWGSWHFTKLRQPALANLFLAAPDVDADEFVQFGANIRHVSRSLHLYASDTDQALEASRLLHGGDYRAGDSRARLRIDGLETVRVSGVDALDPLGHSYYGTNAKILDHMARLMRPPVDLSRPVGSLTARQRELVVK